MTRTDDTLRSSPPPGRTLHRDSSSPLARRVTLRLLAALREAGFDDRAILDAILTIGCFCFVNRLVLATGLALEPEIEATCRPDLAG